MVLGRQLVLERGDKMTIYGQIPLSVSPWDSFYKGASGTSNLLKSLLEQNAKRQETQQSAEMHPLNLKFKKGQIQRQAAQAELDPFRKMLLQARIHQATARAKKAEYDADPKAQMAAIQELMSLYGEAEGGGGQDSTPQSLIPGIGNKIGQHGAPAEQQQPNYDELASMIPAIMGKIGQGGQPGEQLPDEQSFVPGVGQVGAEEPEPDLQSAIAGIGALGEEEQPPEPPAPPHPKYNNLQKKIIEGVLKKKFGIDLGSESAQEKRDNDYNKWQREQEYKAAHPEAKPGAITSAERLEKLNFERDKLEEQKKHNRELEKAASLDTKIKLAEERKNIETELAKNKAAIKAESAYTESLNKEEAKIYTGMQKEAIKGIETDANYREIGEVIRAPETKTLLSHPALGELTIAYYNSKGTPEQQYTVGRLKHATNELVASTAKGLNTRFTDKDLALARQMKIDDSDSFEAAQAKAEAIIFLHNLGQSRLDASLRLIRESQAAGKRVSPYEATKEADKLINAEATRKAAHAMVFGNTTGGKNGNVVVIDPNGKRFTTTKENAAQLPEGWRHG